MKFRIEKRVVSVKSDIRGCLISREYRYSVYRSFCFGLFRCYIRISPCREWDNADEVYVRYVSFRRATLFSFSEAERLIESMRINPRRFVRYKEF